MVKQGRPDLQTWTPLRREIMLTYARIQHIYLTSNIVGGWLGRVFRSSDWYRPGYRFDQQNGNLLGMENSLAESLNEGVAPSLPHEESHAARTHTWVHHVWLRHEPSNLRALRT